LTTTNPDDRPRDLEGKAQTEIVIRAEEAGDRDSALEVERLAFDSAEESGIVESVRDEEGSFGLVAEARGRVVGHVQFSRGWIGETAVLALGPIGVLPERHGRGIGSALIRGGLDEARSRGEIAVMLLGDPLFYSRFGFRPGSALGLSNPFTGVRPDGFMIREEDFMLVVLEPVPLSGEVRWHPAFDQPVERPSGDA
jgi:putative acetyltransferase